MTNKMPCDLIRDLFPSYIDGLTSKASNEAVEEHISECEACKRILKDMKGEPDGKSGEVGNPGDVGTIGSANGSNPAENTKKRTMREIDYLKGTRRHYLKKVIIAIAAALLGALLLVGAFAFYLSYLKGFGMNPEYLYYTYEIAGNNMQLSVSATDCMGVRDIAFSEEDGVVKIAVTGTRKSMFSNYTRSEEFRASTPISRVYLGNRLIWAEGTELSPITGSVYATYHNYVGDMPANGSTVTAMNMVGYTGNFKSALHTTEEPYGWTMTFERSFSKNRAESLEKRLDAYAYVLLAEIGNLSYVEYVYEIEGENFTKTVTAGEASDFAGQDIKAVGTDVVLLDRLIRSLGLDKTGAWAETEGAMAGTAKGYSKDAIVLTLRVVNFASDGVKGIGVLRLLNGENIGSTHTGHANESLLGYGEISDFIFLKEDFGEGLKEGDLLAFTISVETEDGSFVEVPGEIRAEAAADAALTVTVTGNVTDGYILQ